jgi:hypothetical protein
MVFTRKRASGADAAIALLQKINAIKPVPENFYPIMAFLS